MTFFPWPIGYGRKVTLRCVYCGHSYKGVFRNMRLTAHYLTDHLPDVEGG